jgi:hypothetical protein
MDRKYKYPSDCEKNDIDGDFCGKNGGYSTFYGTVQKKHGTLRAHVKMMARMELC